MIDNISFLLKLLAYVIHILAFFDLKIVSWVKVILKSIFFCFKIMLSHAIAWDNFEKKSWDNFLNDVSTMRKCELMCYLTRIVSCYLSLFHSGNQALDRYENQCLIHPLYNSFVFVLKD